jgi:hypothetical protein
MRVSTSIQTVSALTATARHIAGTYGNFSMLELSIVTDDGTDLKFDLFLPNSATQAEMAEIYARHINAAALEVASLGAIDIQTVVEGEAA